MALYELAKGGVMKDKHFILKQNIAEGSTLVKSGTNNSKVKAVHAKKQRSGSVISNNLVALIISLIVSVIIFIPMMVLPYITSAWGNVAQFFCLAVGIGANVFFSYRFLKPLPQRNMLSVLLPVLFYLPFWILGIVNSSNGSNKFITIISVIGAALNSVTYFTATIIGGLFGNFSSSGAMITVASVIIAMIVLFFSMYLGLWLKLRKLREA